MEEIFSAKSRYICQTEIRDKKIQTVKCKTIEIETDDGKKPSNKNSDHDHIHSSDDSSSEEDDDDVDFNEKDDEEISPKLISIKQELQLQTTGAINVDASSFINIENFTGKMDIMSF